MFGALVYLTEITITNQQNMQMAMQSQQIDICSVLEDQRTQSCAREADANLEYIGRI